jgi:hypothetical protein
LFTVLAAGSSSVVLAGGGPENVMLVVNSSDPDSMTVANHYIKLRGIPAENVFMLPWNAGAETTDIDAFRAKILTPVLSAIDERHLGPQINCVVYSSGFPWGINLDADAGKFLQEAADFAAKQAGNGNGGDASKQGDDGPRGDAPKKPTWPAPLTKVGSLNGLTYLWQPVLAANFAYFQLQSNLYMRRPIPEQQNEPTIAFRGSRRFGPKGELVEAGGLRYLLSTMLAVTSGRGNTVDEVLDYLRRSAEADGTRPTGTIYFMKNGDIRSKVRHDAFPAVVEELKRLGVAAEILDGIVPKDKPDVQGAMVGAASFDWKSCGSTIRPGAVCEHFTSFGGVLRAGAGQTPLSEFLRYGAAGASGTVVEPYAIPDKFPNPMVHVHYARGCTLAEAFYQSVFGPYQLLIVGDPLCRPWANIPQVAVEGVQPGAVVKGTVTLRPTGTVPRDGKIDRCELFVDGRRVAACGCGETLQVHTLSLAEGWHELRVVAVEAGPIASQGRAVLPIAVDNRGGKIDVAVEPPGPVKAGKPLAIAVESPGAMGIVVLHNSRLIGKAPGAKARIEIDPATLGLGPARLRVVAIGNGGPNTCVSAPPLELNVVK